MSKTTNRPAKPIRLYAPIDSDGEIVWSLIRDNLGLVEAAVKRFNAAGIERTLPWRPAYIEIRELPRTRRAKR